MDHFFSFLFFAAATQGFFLAIILGLHKRNSQANKILALWVALLSVDLLQQIYYAENYYQYFPEWIGVINFLPLTYGGFLYLYVRSLTQAVPISWRDLVHFASYILMMTLNLPLLVQPSAIKLELIHNIMAGNPPWTIQFAGILTPLIATIYAVISFRCLLRSAHNNPAHHFLWLRVMLGFNLIIWLVVWGTSWLPVSAGNQLIYTLVSLFIYTLGYFSLRQADGLAFIDQKKYDEKNQHSDQNNGTKYGDNRLPDALRDQLLAELEKYMTQAEPWRSSQLNLPQLSEATGIASHHISQVLNDHHGQSFNDYLNSFRVRALCARLREQPTQNLLALAMECGFSTKSSFNTVFKKHTGTTPSKYRNLSHLS